MARHPKAQGQLEGLPKLMNKTAAIACAEGIDVNEATYDMFEAYHETPHPATGTAPYELLLNRAIRTRLDHYPTERACRDEVVRKRDSKYKEKLKSYHDLTFSVSLLLMITFAMSHNLTGLALADLLTLINAHLLVPNCFAKSIATLNSFFSTG